ncbi:MAG: DNA repair protein RecN [Clostridia bacterium]|nr:DNA repair protein RecN [Clostridia bacterium]
MLDSLHIENMAVIRSLDVDFGGGLSVISGETGSGKSVMMDSLAFLLGGRPERELVRSGTEQALVSAVFSNIGAAATAYLAEQGLEAEDELLLQRTLTADGKSRCRLNGRAVPQSILRGLSGYLVSIHGQNDNQLLLQKAAQARILDSCADFGDTTERYTAAFAAYTETERRLASLRRDSAEQSRLRDMLEFQIADIDAAKLRCGEEEELLARRVKLQNAERIAKQTAFLYRALYGSEKGSAALILERASQAMHQLSGMMTGAEEMAQKLMSMRYEVEDMANTARDFAEDFDTDPTEALNRVEARLDTITKLRRKYGADIAEILEFRRTAAERLSLLENTERSEAELQKQLAAQRSELTLLADALHQARERAAEELCARVLAELSFLDMPAVRFDIALARTAEFGAHGNDDVEFCIATNPGEPLLPLSRIASGGELARIMLALKSVLNERDGVATAVFDEVDTGISGKTARKIGIKLSEIGRATQVISITHSAQIASLASAHYRIVKHAEHDRAHTTVERLDEQGRVAEVARILGGLSVTEAQREAAREMIEEGRAYR